VLLLAVAALLGTAQSAYAAPQQPDAEYLNAAYQLNLATIAAAQAAKTEGRTACVRRAGALMERDHRKLAAQDAEVARRFGIKLPAGPSTARRRQLDALASKAGTSGYDAAWLALQRQLHQHYLTLIDGPLPKAASPAVESVANAARPVVQMNQRMVAGPCRAETGSPTVPTGEGGQVAASEQARTRAALLLLGVGVLLLLVGKKVPVRRRLLGVAAVAVALAMVFGKPPGNSGEVPQAGAIADSEAAVPPVKLALPGVLEATVTPVATAHDGALQVPRTTADVGWWAAGAAPGSAGGTVLLAGHVDTARGRGVFAALSQVPVGARVAVTDGDGDEHWYRIVARRTYQQDALPADLFRGAAKPRLALVTCTGSYDRLNHMYSQNLVLYGVPLD
jgi:predicted outer membrane protein